MKRDPVCQAFRVAAVLLIALAAAPASRGGTFVISDPLAVEDAALLDREFGGWNLGSGLLLEAGYDTPRWTAFMDVARAIPLARVYIKLRQSQYDSERTEEQVKHSEKFGQ